MTRRAEVHLLLQDATLTDGGAPATAREILQLPDHPPDSFLDGPACRRLAVVDLDPDTGVPLPPAAVLERPAKGRVTGRYHASGGPGSASSVAINAFGTAWKTLTMFERPLGLGRPVRWAFPGEQLLIVPRAGTWDNAFYERRTRSLQFFSFEAASGEVVHTALSRDVVAHETGHALLDAVAPWLHDTTGPQSIATHEAVADLVAALVAIDSNPLRERVLRAIGNDLLAPNAFTMIAEQYGRSSADAGSGRLALRDLTNTLTTADVAARKPHEVSQVLSGVLFDTLAATYASVRAELTRSGALSPEAVANRALGTASQLVQRLLIQGLDLLPPGEVGFADVGRAILAADRALQPEDRRLRPHRRAFAERFVARGIVGAAADLDQDVPAALSVAPAEVGGLLAGDWAAYRYVDARRDLLGVPADAQVRVLPRLAARKKYGAVDPATRARKEERQLILRVTWEVVEPTALPGLGTASGRRITTGATVALRWASGEAVALVVGRAASDARQRAERDELVGALLAAPEGSGPTVTVSDGVLEVMGTQALLHLGAWAAPRARKPPAAIEGVPPAGVDAGPFFDLLWSRRPT